MISDLPEALLPALNLFRNELDTHLQYFKDNLSLLKQSDNEDVRSSLQHRFHTIRGSAGFLQLSDIRDAAEEAEKALKNKEMDSDKLQVYVSERVQKLEVLFADLKRELDAL